MQSIDEILYNKIFMIVLLSYELSHLVTNVDTICNIHFKQCLFHCVPLKYSLSDSNRTAEIANRMQKYFSCYIESVTNNLQD